MTNLIFFSIGPVQSFIAQARKTQDLFAGSKLLSDLCGKAMQVIGSENIVFPKGVENSALPNRFLAKISDISDAETKKLLAEAEQAVRDHFKKVADDCYLRHSGKTKKIKGFDPQIDNFLEIYHTWVPIEENDFKSAYLQGDRRMASLKNIRHFAQFEYPDGTLGEAGRKCHLDGERNALFFGKASNALYLLQGIELSEDHVWVDKNEGLSAVSFVKRFYKRHSEHKFNAESVAEIALKHKTTIKTESGYQYHTAFNQYRDFVSGILGFYDDQLSYIENLTRDKFKDFSDYQKALDWHKCLIAPLIKENTDRHYAILRFDGDNMGKWISGEYIPQQDLEAFQKNLSELLLKFAKTAEKTILTKEKGASVYAGGDDFIGFVNLHYLFPVLNELRAAFKHEVNDQLVRLFPSLSREFTFSAGIAIAHYKTPLSVVLKEAKKAEDHAKEIDTFKNAVAICRIKKSGETQICRFKFGAAKYDEKFEFAGFENLNRISHILQALKTDFSTSFIRAYQLAFAPVGSDFILQEEDMAKTELLRLVIRSKNTPSVSIESCRALSKAFDPFLLEPDFEDFLNVMDFTHRQTSK
jgi:CRISPR-associated protein Cmr2